MLLACSGGSIAGPALLHEAMTAATVGGVEKDYG